MNDYRVGFNDKCAESGVDPEVLLKTAVRGDQLERVLRKMIAYGHKSKDLGQRIAGGPKEYPANLAMTVAALTPDGGAHRGSTLAARAAKFLAEARKQRIGKPSALSSF
jgi:hypothetical protein